MKTILFFSFSLLLSAQNFCVHATHGILFEEEERLASHHSYLNGVNLRLLPLQDPDIMQEATESGLQGYKTILENEYAIDGVNQLAAIGIYDCTALVIPSISMMMHIHERTNLENIEKIVKPYLCEEVFLYTSSIGRPIKKVLETLDRSGFQRQLITLSIRPLAIEEISDDFSPFKYSYSYEGDKKVSGMPQKVTFFVKEDEKQIVKNIYSQNLPSWKNGYPATNFMTQIRQPLNIVLKDGVVEFCKINYDLMRSTQEQCERKSILEKDIVEITF
ncbi:MAG: hypothetical protein KA112_03075 [Alphaproteobacteria bacterium]|nr:hypothetical protein [Alphaproteobacteria bacterium]MBP7729581.1 hypothetical protein [Alphaproteobacteria bacterium]